MKAEYPVGTIVASDTMAYIKKERGTYPYDYEQYWMGAEGWACPFYGDSQVNIWIDEGTHKIVRLGKDG